MCASIVLFLSRSFGPSLSRSVPLPACSHCSLAVLSILVTHTHVHVHTHKRLYLFLTLSGRHHLCFEIEVVKVARARADPAEDWQRPRHWRSWCTRSGWNRGGTWLDGLFSRLMHKYRPKMAVARSRITLSFMSRQMDQIYILHSLLSFSNALSLAPHSCAAASSCVPTIHPVYLC